MQKRKKTVLQFLNLISATLPLKMLIALSSQRTVFPFYHAVSDDDIPHIKHLYDIRSFKDFKSDIEYLLKFYEPVSIDQLSKIQKENTKKKYMFLSFDDGLRQVKDFIAPFLYEKGIPGHVFINSSFLNNKNLMFRYKVSLIIEELNKMPGKEVKNKIVELLNNDDQNSDTRASLLNLKYNDVCLIEKIANLLQLEFKTYLDNYQPYLTSVDIKRLMAQGFTFGSHSIDHPEFQYIDLNQQIFQTSESIKRLENELSLDIRSFAFPFTDHNVKNDYFDNIKRLGIVDYTFGGAGIKKEKIDTHLQRIPIEEYKDNIKKIIHTEYLYYLLKAPFGKNTIKR